MPQTDRPNILFIMDDQHRFDYMGCAGADFVRTPNIDRLAKQGYTLPNVRQIARFARLRALHWLLGCSLRASGALGTIASCLVANRLITSNCAITIITWVVWASSTWPNPMGIMDAMATGPLRICGALPIRSNARAKCTPGIPKHRRGLITTFWRKKGCSMLLSMIIPVAQRGLSRLLSRFGLAHRSV